MNEEVIIREEARDFFKWSIDGSEHHQPIKLFHKIKDRLHDFYPDEFKAIFLDEIQMLKTIQLVQHIKEDHNGISKPGCQFEITAQKLMFYINQEIKALPLFAHQRAETNPLQKRDKVFISYSHLDKEHLIDIQRHFKPFLSQIDYWDDSKIQPGQKWKDEITKAINGTKVAILLVSTDFLGSDFITTDELPPLLKAAEENGAVIMIVILKPCLFEKIDKLKIFQTLNPPSKPVIKMDYVEKEELYANLVSQTIRRNKY